MVKELILKEHDCYSDKCIIISGKCKVNKNIFTNHLKFVSSRSIIKVKNKQQLNQRKIYKIMFNDKMSTEGDYKNIAFLTTLKSIIDTVPQNVFYTLMDHELGTPEIYKPKIAYKENLAILILVKKGSPMYFLDEFLNGIPITDALIIKMLCYSRFDISNILYHFTSNDPFDFLSHHFFKTRKFLLNYTSLERCILNPHVISDMCYRKYLEKTVLSGEHSDCYINLLRFLCNRPVKTQCIVCSKLLIQKHINKNVF